MRELVRPPPRFGYRRIGALRRGAGFRVNRKRVYRLGRQQGLKVPRKKRKKRRLGHSGTRGVRQRARHKDHVWAWAFIHARTQDGRPLKWRVLVDAFTRACLALAVGRGMTAPAATAVRARVVGERGVPGPLRSDNGPERIAKALRSWLAQAGVGTLYIEPGAPWEKGYAESFNSRLREELLESEEFTSLREARVLGKQWQEPSNTVRPHSALGYRTPAAFAASCLRADSAKPAPPRKHDGNG
jgi:transposase InsO family protein